MKRLHARPMPMQPYASGEAKGCIAFPSASRQNAAMQPRTEEFLNLLLWSDDKLARPTFRNLTDSYEAWAYRTGLLRQVATLEKARLVERARSSEGDRLYRLTEPGRLHVLGGRDPE